MRREKGYVNMWVREWFPGCKNCVFLLLICAKLLDTLCAFQEVRQQIFRGQENSKVQRS